MLRWMDVRPLAYVKGRMRARVRQREHGQGRPLTFRQRVKITNFGLTPSLARAISISIQPAARRGKNILSLHSMPTVFLHSLPLVSNAESLSPDREEELDLTKGRKSRGWAVSE